MTPFQKNEGIFSSILNTNKLLVHDPILENEGIILSMLDTNG